MINSISELCAVAVRRAGAGACFGRLEVEDKAERLSLLIESQGAHAWSVATRQPLTDRGLRPLEPGKNLFFPSLLKGGGMRSSWLSLWRVRGNIAPND